MEGFGKMDGRLQISTKIQRLSQNEQIAPRARANTEGAVNRLVARVWTKVNQM